MGGTFYAIEIPNYFRYIDIKIRADGKKKWIYKTLAAMAYFNPLWIARHIFFIRLFSGGEGLQWYGIFAVGLQSFLVNIPLSFLGNFIIQNKISLKSRFIASAVFSSFMAIFYALLETWLS